MSPQQQEKKNEGSVNQAEPRPGRGKFMFISGLLFLVFLPSEDWKARSGGEERRGRAWVGLG